ncbi:MAG: tetraacyldisaccharide 4'-kinase [Myxococcota bacterium]
MTERGEAWRRCCIEWTAAARLYHWLYDRGWCRDQRASIPVVSVGGLRMGGEGKTPMARLVAEHFLQGGVKAAIVSRGYRRQSRGVVVVSLGEGPLVDVKDCGDEPWMLAVSTRAMIVVGARRHDAVEQAAALGAQVAILDDGFQHRRLRRDLDIVLVDRSAPAWVLPWGSAREPPSALARASLVVDCGAPDLRVDREVGAMTRFDGWRGLDGRTVEPPRSAVLVSAIARAERFETTVVDQGTAALAHFAFRDHRWLNRADIARAEQKCSRLGAEGLVTTAKDAARWPSGGRLPVWVANIRLEIVRGHRRFDDALKAVGL